MIIKQSNKETEKSYRRCITKLALLVDRQNHNPYTHTYTYTLDLDRLFYKEN